MDQVKLICTQMTASYNEPVNLCGKLHCQFYCPIYHINEIVHIKIQSAAFGRNIKSSRELERMATLPATNTRY